MDRGADRAVPALGASTIATSSSVAVVTGANRGIGREVVRQLADRGWIVVLTARNAEQAQAAAHELTNELGSGAGTIAPAMLDVTNNDGLAVLAGMLRAKLGRVDALVNNAGIIEAPAPDTSAARGSGTNAADATHDVAGTPTAVVRDTLDTNTLGAYRVSRALAPMIAESGGGNIVNVSSGMGQLSEMGGGYPAYRISKAALNAVTRVMSAEFAADAIAVNSVCPGWVQTDMGGASASLSIEEGADTVAWLARDGADGASGRFWRAREIIDW